MADVFVHPTAPGSDSNAAFAAIADAWFELLADGADAADLAAGPGAAASASGGAQKTGGLGNGAAPPLLDLLAGVRLSSGVLGAYTPTPLLEPTHLEVIPPGFGGACDYPFSCGGALAAADAAGGGGRQTARLCREEWGRMMRGCHEVMGPSLFFHKALAAVGPHGRSLFGHLVLLSGREYYGPRCQSPVDSSVAAEAALTLLRATGLLKEGAASLRSFLCSGALPDGEAIAASPQLEELLVLHTRMQVAAQVAATMPPSPQMVVNVPPTEPCEARHANVGVAEEEALVTLLDAALVAPQPPPTTPAERVGANVDAGMLIGVCRPSSSSSEGGEQRECSVCFETLPLEQLRRCGRGDCDKPYCLECLRRHAETVVGDSLYAVPSVRCPSCNRRIATEAWTPHVGAATLAKYRENARALLTYRCPACDETSSYLADSGLPGRDPFVAREPEVRQRLAVAWRRYFLGEIHADQFLQIVLDEHTCGHRIGGAPPGRMSRIFGPSGGAPWISDLERRLALQLAWMHRFPRQRTPCCAERFCFRCKVSSWHRGISCRERLRAERTRQAQSCPGCGVPTQRSEGCRSIACVCGRVWEWQGDDSSEDGSFDDASEEEADAEQAQTVLNLIAMNRWAQEDTVTEALTILLEARADVGDANAGALNAVQSPLLLAVQNRNTSVARSLSASGARVTLQILEEVRNVSQDSVRRGFEELLRPHIQNDTSTRLPLWVWVQEGCMSAVDALLRNAAHEEEIGVDVINALHRCCGEESTRQNLTARVREQVGEHEFERLQVSAATGRMLQEFRQAYDEERSIDADLVQECLAMGADANAREEDRMDDGYADEGVHLGLTGLGLLAMNCACTADTVTKVVEAMLQAQADVNLESDEMSTPLQAALQHRNVPAIEALCQAPVKFSSELLDEARTVSEPSRRREVEELLKPVLDGRSSCELPLWVSVQGADVPAVEAHLRRSENCSEIVDTDALVALQRFRGDEDVRQQLQDLLREAVGTAEFERTRAAAATWRLVQELRESYDDQRPVVLDVVQDALRAGADPNAQEDAGDFDDGVRDYSMPAFHLLVTNPYTSAEVMEQAVASMVEAKADLDSGSSDTPLVAAMQSHCVAGVQALGRHGVKVTPQVFEEMRNISSAKTRHCVEDVLHPLVIADSTLRCPMWIWVQAGNTVAVEAMLRNSAHQEEVNVDVLMALQRCRCNEGILQQLTTRIQEHAGVAEFQRLSAFAASRRLLMELRDAHTEKRNIDLDLVRDTVAQGANPNAREESLEDDLEDEEEEEAGEEEEREEEEDEEEEEEDGDGLEEPEEEGTEDTVAPSEERDPHDPRGAWDSGDEDGC